MTAEEALEFLQISSVVHSTISNIPSLSSTTYDHPSGMFSLSLPEEWVGNVSYVEMEDSAAFYTEADFELLISIHPQPTSWVEANLSENIISLSSFETNGVPHQYILEYSLSDAATRQDEELFQSLLAQVDQIGFRSSVTPELIDQLVHDSYESDMAAAIAYLPYLSWSSYRDTYGESDTFSLLSALREYTGSGQAEYIKNMALFNQAAHFNGLIINNARLDGLTEDLRGLLERAASEAAEFRTEALQADNDTYMQLLTDEYAVQFYTPTEEEIAELEEAIVPVYENFVATHEFGEYAAAIAEICAAN